MIIKILNFLKRNLWKAIVVISALVILVPLWMVITGSIMGQRETLGCIGPVIGTADGKATWHIFPDFPTLKPYVQLMLDTPEFFAMFWNSTKQVLSIIAGQLIIAVPAAWGFARYKFPGKKVLFGIYMVLMILPFQVTMVSNYLVLDFLGMMDTHWAIILPGIFSTFPVFIISKFFSSIPESILEAARLDGAGELQLFVYIGIPLGRSGVISSVVLVFLEYWNAIEQPMIFLSDQSKWPLSLYLPQVDAQSVGFALASSVLMMLPALLLFLYGQSYLESGIQASGLKE